MLTIDSRIDITEYCAVMIYKQTIERCN